MEPREVFSERSGNSRFRRPTLLETKWGWALTALIGLWGLGLLAHGIVTLVAPNFRGDLFLRWNEQRILLQGADPYDVSAFYGDFKPTASESARIDAHRLRDIGPILPSGYPPWAFTISLLFIYPFSLRADQVVFAAWSMAGLGVTLYWAYRFGRPCGRGAAWFLTAGALAVNGNAATLRLGQYGLLLNAFLLLAVIAEVRRRPIASGLAMAIVALKPTYSFLQFVVWIFRRRWTSLVVVAVVCLGASLAPWALTGVDPLEMLRQMFRQAAGTRQGDTTLLSVAAIFVNLDLASTCLALLGLTATAALGWRYRTDSALIGLSIAAVIGRMVFYHRQYDNTMLLIPLVVFGRIALEKNERMTWFLFTLFALTLWAPLRHVDYTRPVIFGLCVCWTIGLAAICRYARLVPAAEGPGREGA